MPTKKLTLRPTTRVAKKHKSESVTPYTPLDFKEVDKRCIQLANHIETHFEELAHVLLEYESYEVVQDEMSRTLDMLRSLKENKSYFKLRVGQVTAFLPRNQPLYALTCFVIVPSLMASEVHFRIPHSMRHFMPKMLALLDIYLKFPNVHVSHKKRNEFLLERSALRVNPKTLETIPVTDVVIFTGMPSHADQLRLVFDDRTLFISNGAGHNPLVVSKDADIVKAVEATLTLQLYNQGQDCAAPNAILVHKDIFPVFLRRLRDGLRTVGVGPYTDRVSRVGPISDPKDLVRIQDFLIHNRYWLDSTTPGIIRAQDATLEPTIICKPLKEGGNFMEIFAPIIFLQEYEKDADLALYFEDKHYALNAMYITLYGTSDYIESLAGKEIGKKVLHDKGSILHNIHLHASGVERGTQPYGGNGYGASSLSINRKIISKATLPQRDIYEWVAKPLLRGKSLQTFRKKLAQYSDIKQKDVQKLLRLKMNEERREEGERGSFSDGYLDTETLKDNNRRYVHVTADQISRLLEHPNVSHIAKLEIIELEWIRELRKLLLEKPAPVDEFKTALYVIPKKDGLSEKENRARQLRFFQHVYHLLLGKDSGPRLTQFLAEVDSGKACELLDV